MTIQNILKYWKKVLGLCLMIFAVTSCTYDYFEDENNFRLYVPQIKAGEIENFYIAIHDVSGRHIVTREITAPFDKDPLMKQGILRFKLPHGNNYKISCFADYAHGSHEAGNHFDDSYLKENLFSGTNIYNSRVDNPRVYLSTVTVYPIGHSEVNIPKLINIDENQRYKGKVTVNFQELPASVSRIDIQYKGLATKYRFDGDFDRFSADDRILASFNTSDYTSAGGVSFTNILNPSVGVEPFGLMAPLVSFRTKAASGVAATPLELGIFFFDSAGTNTGMFSFTTDDFDRLRSADRTKVPVDKWGGPVSSLVLNPQQSLVFTFKGFTVISIKLVGWGDITSGGTTPM